MNGLHILATGSSHPKKVLTNEDLSHMVETNDEWIRTRTGIQQRYIAEEETHTSLAAAAAELAISRSGIDREQIGVCIVSTLTPDFVTPSSACLMQRKLGLSSEIIAFDLNSACTGFMFGLKTAHALLHQISKPYALVIGCDVLSRITDYTDRSTCILFGDGAGAVVAELDPNRCFFDVTGVEGGDELLRCPGVGYDKQYLFMNGSEVFRFAVDKIVRCTEELFSKSGLTMDDIDHVICHQANQRIIAAAVRKLHAPEEKFFVNLQNYGNTSAASIPIALDEMASGGQLHTGEKLLCIGFGGGLTWGGLLLEW